MEADVQLVRGVGFLEPNQDFSARGIQTRSFGAGWADFVLEFFKMFHLYTGGQFLLPQRANTQKRDIFQFQKWMRQGVFSAWGIQIGPIGAT